MSRNYYAELKSLGKTYQSIASELNLSPRTVSKYARAIAKPPRTLYEPTRNIFRRTAYNVAREAGYKPERARLFRRTPTVEILKDKSWIKQMQVDYYREWNFKYNAYKLNPAGWKKAHPNAKIPRRISKAEIKRRMERGIQNGKTREEIENY